MFFPVNETHNLWYRFFGKKELPLVMYLHGGPGGYHDLSIKKFINFNKYSFLTYDQRGCGKSVPFLSTDDNTFESNLEDIHKLISHFSPDRPVVLIGDSYGTQLAIKYAIKYPHEVSKLILTGLWLGSREDVHSLYHLKCQKYPEVCSVLFGTNTINIAQEFENIKQGKRISGWLIWESFLGSSNKEAMIPYILRKAKIFYRSKEDRAIAFFESLYFSQDNYYNNQVSYEELASLSNKLEIYHGFLDEVCLPLNTEKLDASSIKYTIISDMGHMPESDEHHEFIFKSLS